MLYQSYFTSIISQISNIVTQVPIITKGLESVSSVGDVLLAPDIEDNFDKEKVKEVGGDIEFKDVSFGYDKIRQCLINSVFTLKRGNRRFCRRLRRRKDDDFKSADRLFKTDRRQNIP